MIDKRYVCFVLSLIIFAGCKTTEITQVPYKKEYSKYVNDMAILYYAENPEMDVSIRNDEMFFSKLMAGPAMIPQLFMRLAHNSANQDDIRVFNDMIFDVNIGELLCEKLNTKFQLCSYFHVVPQERITENKAVWELLEKKNKDIKNYQKIGTELGVDTLLEINVISYGLKDPGVLSDPYVFLNIDVKMTTASEGTVIWRDIVQAMTAVGMDTLTFQDMIYGDVQYLKAELEDVAVTISERCIEKLGFDTNYTYMLEEDYIKKTEHKINIAEKLNELNVLRNEDLISNADYDKTKLDLIEKAKGRSGAGQSIETKLTATTITDLESK